MKANQRTTVLVTGISGLIGGVVRRQLGGAYDLRALGRRPVAGVSSHVADVASLEAIQPGFAGVDTVVHLAATVDGGAGLHELLGPNIVGAYNVLEAARRAGVRRVVLASSGAVVAGYEREPPYQTLAAGRYADVGAWETLTHLSPPRHSDLYGCSKVWGEALGRYYADAHGLSVICLRIGHVTAGDRPVASRDFCVWCSQRDVGRMIEACVAAPASVCFDVFFAVSNNRWGYRDLTHARDVLGWVPLDAAEDHR